MKSKYLNFVFNQTTNHFLQNISLYIGKCISRPQSISIAITERCNAKCEFCNIWKKATSKKELTIIQWRCIILNLRRWLGSFSLTFSGGEPFLRRDIFELIKFANNNRIITNVVTNGALFENSLIDKIAESPLDRLTISLESIKTDLHDRLRKIENLRSRIISGIRYLNRKKRGPSIILATILLEQNLDEILNLVDFVEQQNLNGILIQPLTQNLQGLYNPSWYRLSNFKIKDYKKLNKVLNKLTLLKENGAKIINSLNHLKLLKDYYKNPKKQLQRCTAGISNFAIDPYGDARFCYNMEKIGNLKEELPQEIWYSKKAQLIRSNIRKCNLGCSIRACYPNESLVNKFSKFLKYI